MVLPIIALTALAAAVPEAPCAGARAQFEQLSFEAAQTLAQAGLSDPKRPLGCLEVLGLVKLVLEQPQAARAAFTELFERAPNYKVEEGALTPTQTEFIARIKAEAQPLLIEVRARWLYHEAVRIDVQLEGGLRGAEQIRYRAEGDKLARDGQMQLLGRVASATVAVPAAMPLERMRMSGQVLDGLGRVVQPFSAELLLLERPSPPQGQVVEKVIVKTEEKPLPWYWWVVIGVASAGVVAAGTTAVVLAQPDKPASAGLGIANVDP